VIVCDTGPLVAAAIRNDDDYRACVDLFASLHLAGRRILVPGPVVAEVGFLLAAKGGPRVESAFLRSFAEGTLTPVGVEPSDFARMADLVDIYADFPLGTTDAAVVAVAERLNIREVATLDHRHFRAVRPRHVGSFTLLP
jgi:predicted nucleic acid-binding protein